MKLTPGNAQDIGSRARQQDAFGFSDPGDAGFVRHAGLLAVLADGMGGLERGEEASRLAVRTFLAEYAQKHSDQEIPSALDAAMAAANSAVNGLGRGAGSEAPGTTLVAAAVRGDELYWIAAGDSSLYLWRGGSLTQLNTPHIYARALDLAVTAGKLTDAAAQADPQRDALTSYLGVGTALETDRNIRPLKLQSGDRVVLCSDGLSNTLSESEIAAALGSGHPQEACEALVSSALDRQAPGQDNITILLLDAASDEPAPKRKWWRRGR